MKIDGITEGDLLAHAARLGNRLGEPGWGIRRVNPRNGCLQFILMHYADAISPPLSKSDMWLWIEASSKMYYYLEGR